MAEIVYLEHPVSQEQKSEWRSKGFKILDIAFKPADAEDKPKKGKQAKEKLQDEEKSEDQPE